MATPPFNAATVAAVDRTLALEPRNVRALILKADHLAALGDDRAAASFYQFALQASPPPERTPPELRAELDRARASCARYAQKLEQFLMTHIQAHNSGAGVSSARFQQSLDILLGKKNTYFQRPQTFYFAELPQIQFYDRAALPWLDRVEAATAAIRLELLEVMKDPSRFKPYVEGDPKRPSKDQSGMRDNPDWSAFYLWKNGEVVTENAARCPNTLAALAEVPLPQVGNRSPSILFSLLRPGAHIPPHSGHVNTRVICHLPLLVPPNCALRVGNDIRTPVEGNAWAFDDTIEHEAWNNSHETRVILLFEAWRPELNDVERSLVRAMFEAIDAHTGEKPSWSI